MGPRLKAVREELFEHLPYTVFSVAAALIVLALMTYVATLTAPVAPRCPPGSAAEHSAEVHCDHHDGERAPAVNPNFGPAAQVVFHVFHPLHVLFSAVATVAMFWRHERRWLKALVVGVIAGVGICGLSDVFLPYLAGLLLGVEVMEMHICLIHHPGVVLPFLVAGLLLGLALPASTHKSTIFSHSSHVLVSSVASITYLVGFGLTGWIDVVGMVFVYMVFAVVVPCCASDILFPLLLAGSCSGCPAHPHGHEGADERDPKHHSASGMHSE
jgi:hypothetical protein